MMAKQMGKSTSYKQCYVKAVLVYLSVCVCVYVCACTRY